MVGIGVGLFFGGSVGLDMLGGLYLGDGDPNSGYYMIVGLEETLELVGSTVVIGALLSMLRERPGLLPASVKVVP